MVKATKGQGLVFWSKTFSPEEFIEVGIPSLACFNLTAISIQFNSPSHGRWSTVMYSDGFQ